MPTWSVLVSPSNHGRHSKESEPPRLGRIRPGEYHIRADVLHVSAGALVFVEKSRVTHVFAAGTYEGVRLRAE